MRTAVVWQPFEYGDAVMAVGGIEEVDGRLSVSSVGHRISGFYSRFLEHVSAPISPLSIAVFRIAFGALLLWDVVRYIDNGWIESKYARPDYLFAYDGFGWLPVASPAGLDLIWMGVGVSAFLILIGAVYRIALIGFIACYGYFFLLDKAQYMNHHYMVLLFAILLLAVPGNAALSIDALRKPQAAMRRIHKVLLAAQVEIILVTAGLVKLAPDWLRGAPLGGWLRARQDEVAYGWLFQYDAVILLAAWGTVALHVVGAPFLLWKRTRIPVFVVYCLFHISNAQLFSIGIFPYLTIGASTLLFSPDWPARLWTNLQRRLPLLGQRVASAQPSLNCASFGGASHRVVAFTLLWIVLQATAPWRNVFYDNEVRWTGQGHRYSWRMKIYDRDAYGHFYATDTATGETIKHEPREFFTRRQTRKLLTRPDMIIDAAHHIEERYAAAGQDVEVRAAIYKSLNGREHQLYVDPDIDLSSVDHSPWSSTSIVLSEGPGAGLRVLTTASN